MALDLSLSTSPLQQAAQPQAAAGNTKLHKTANDFTAVFMSQMLGHMYDGMEPDETFGGGKGEEMFRSLMLNEYGKEMSSQGGNGINNAVYQQMLKYQEVSPS